MIIGQAPLFDASLSTHDNNSQKHITFAVDDRESFEKEYTPIFYNIIDSDLKQSEPYSKTGAYTQKKQISDKIQDVAQSFLNSKQDAPSANTDYMKDLYTMSSLIKTQGSNNGTLVALQNTPFHINSFENEVFNSFTFVNFEYEGQEISAEHQKSSELGNFIFFLNLSEKMNVDKETMLSADFQIEVQKINAGGLFSMQRYEFLENDLPRIFNEQNPDKEYHDEIKKLNLGPNGEIPLENGIVVLVSQTTEKPSPSTMDKKYLAIEEKRLTLSNPENIVASYTNAFFSEKLASASPTEDDLMKILEQLQKKNSNEFFDALLSELITKGKEGYFNLDDDYASASIAKITNNTIIGQLYG